MDELTHIGSDRHSDSVHPTLLTSAVNLRGLKAIVSTGTNLHRYTSLPCAGKRQVEASMQNMQDFLASPDGSAALKPKKRKQAAAGG